MSFEPHPYLDNCLYSAAVCIEEWKEKLTELYGDDLTFRIDPIHKSCTEAYTLWLKKYVGAFYEDTNQSIIYIKFSEENNHDVVN